MKYIKIDGTVGECIPYAQSFQELLQEVGPAKCYVLPQIPAKASIAEVVDTTMSIIAMEPPYLPKSEIPWILAYMDGLITFASSYNEKEDKSYTHGTGKVAKYTTRGTGYSSDDDQPIPNFIELTRRFAVVGIILDHLYGKRFYARQARRGKEPRPVPPSIIGMRDDLSASYDNHPWFDRRCLDFMRDRGFKTDMTQGYYKGARGAFTIPPGMQLKFQTGRGDEILKSGDCAPFEVNRFYGTQGGWPDSYRLVGFPEHVDQLEIDTINDLPTLRSSLGKSSFYQNEPLLHMPLSWISHLVKAPSFSSLSDIEVENVNKHVYPPMADTSMNHLIKMKLYQEAIKEANEVRSAMRMCDMDRTSRPPPRE